MAPLVIGLEGVALLATCAYAAFGAVAAILDGGSDVVGGWGITYAAISSTVSVVVWRTMRGHHDRSGLVVAEATQWLAGAVLGLGMLVGFAVALVLDRAATGNAARYVEPTLVLAACAILALPPVRMIRTTLVELLEGAADPEVRAAVDDAVAAVRAALDLPEALTRVTKVGPKLYIEVDFVVVAGWLVERSDLVRRQLYDRLSALPHDLWLNVEFSTDPFWVA